MMGAAMGISLVATRAPPEPPTALPVAFAEHQRDGRVHEPYDDALLQLATLSRPELDRRRAAVDRLFRRKGITFAVHDDEGAGVERLIPFDTIPRVLARSEWTVVEAGCLQRVRALNAFLDDIYHVREILRAGAIPEQAVLGNALYCAAMQGVGTCRTACTSRESRWTGT